MAGRTRVRTAATLARLLPIYIMFGVLKRVVSLERLVRWAWSPPLINPGRDQQARTVACIIRLDRLGSRIDRSCLQRSLLLYRELSRLGSLPTLFVGFRPDVGALKGHAWVEVGGRAVVDEAASLEAFDRAIAFGPGGTVLTPQAPSL